MHSEAWRSVQVSCQFHTATNFPLVNRVPVPIVGKVGGPQSQSSCINETGSLSSLLRI
jgi:hypothetical protein